jgi:hypothetical protein
VIIKASVLRLTGLYALRRFRGSGYEKPSRTSALCVFFLRHIFLCAKIASQFFYRAQKNVAYSQNVMRNTPQNLFEQDGK